MRKLLTALMLGAIATTGCAKKEHPHADPSTICRATPTYVYVDKTLPNNAHGPFDDDIALFTGSTNGDDGEWETLRVCTDNGMATCLTFTGTGSNGGVVVEFVPGYVNIKLALSNGYGYARVQIDRSCH